MKRIAFVCAAALPFVVAAICVFGWLFDCEFIHWPMLRSAYRTQVPGGLRVNDLVEMRAKRLGVSSDWHHCHDCNFVFSHAKYTPVKLRLGSKEAFLFDWDATARRLLPLTMGTAQAFPSLVPDGFVAQVLNGPSLDLSFNGDRPCRIVSASKE